MYTALFLFNLLIFLVIWRFIWIPLRIDICRDAIFNARSSMRDYFIAEKIPLNSKEYAYVRNRLNKTVAYVHNVDIYNLIFFFIAYRGVAIKPENSLSGLNTIQQAYIKKTFNDVSMSILKCIITRSLILLPLITILVVLVVIYSLLLDKKLKNADKIIKKVDISIDHYAVGV